MLMPTKNTVKIFVANTFYHVYNRGWNASKIFRDESDYTYFEQLLMRAFAPEAVANEQGRLYRNFYNDIHLNAYCLMGNHFHLLLYQVDEHGLSNAMKSISTSYSMYFNKKYKQRGSLFESTYKAVPIISNQQLMHITRYIHLNHSSYRTWPRSGYQDYVNGRCRSWIDSLPVLELFSSTEQYVDFVDDYEALQRERDEIKQLLANR